MASVHSGKWRRKKKARKNEMCASRLSDRAYPHRAEKTAGCVRMTRRVCASTQHIFGSAATLQNVRSGLSFSDATRFVGPIARAPLRRQRLRCKKRACCVAKSLVTLVHGTNIEQLCLKIVRPSECRTLGLTLHAVSLLIRQPRASENRHSACGPDPHLPPPSTFQKKKKRRRHVHAACVCTRTCVCVCVATIATAPVRFPAVSRDREKRAR
jgi:hypothetical protein